MMFPSRLVYKETAAKPVAEEEPKQESQAPDKSDKSDAPEAAESASDFVQGREHIKGAVSSTMDATREGVNGVVQSAFKAGEVAVDLVDPVIEVGKGTAGALHDWFIKVPASMMSEDGEGVGHHVAHGFEQIGDSVVKGFSWKNVKEIAGDSAGVVGGLCGVKYAGDKWNKMALREEGLLPMVGSLGKGIGHTAKGTWHLMKAPFTRDRGEKSEDATEVTDTTTADEGNDKKLTRAERKAAKKAAKNAAKEAAKKAKLEKSRAKIRALNEANHNRTST